MTVKWRAWNVFAFVLSFGFLLVSDGAATLFWLCLTVGNGMMLTEEDDQATLDEFGGGS